MTMTVIIISLPKGLVAFHHLSRGILILLCNKVIAKWKFVEDSSHFHFKDRLTEHWTCDSFNLISEISVWSYCRWTFHSQGMKRMYAVVSFTGIDEDDASVEAVPIAWLTPNKTRCRWPPYTKHTRVSKALKNYELPNSDWTTCEAKCITVCCK